MRQKARPDSKWLLLILVLLLAWWAYHPGLSGGFLFDDYANLPSLGARGPIDTWPAFWRYVTSGTNDPLGRPIALASFLLDAHNWPASPAPFLRTSLWLHLANIVLLAGFLLALGRAAGLTKQHTRWAALLGAALWGLHPLLVSTTLYIVQREAMLPATFILIGLWVWLAGRRRWLAGRVKSGAALEWLGLAGGTLLASLSKADGALLCFYALLIEWLVLVPHDARSTPRGHRITMLLLAVLPALAIAGYLVSTALHFMGAPPPFGRDWTVGQRLLTEPRVVLDYLKLLWLPRPFTPGLFNDQIRASTSLLQPVTTLPALLGIFGLIAGAFALHRRAPLWALALLFYFAGQLIESTSIPIELYFEHRNYVPSLLMFWPLAVWLARPSVGTWPVLHRGGGAAPTDDAQDAKRGSRPAPGPIAVAGRPVLHRGEGAAPTGRKSSLRSLSPLLAVVLVLMLATMTHARASVWGDRVEQALLWARLNPDSPRAQSYAAQILTARGRPRWALKHLPPLLLQDPTQIQIAFNLVGADCALGHVPQSDIDATLRAIRTTRRLGALSFKWIGDAIDKAHAGQCKGLTMPVVAQFIRAAWANPGTARAYGWRQDILDLRGRFALAQNQPELAWRRFAQALAVHPTADTALAQAAILGTAGHQHLALCELGLLKRYPPVAPGGFSMRRVHAWVLKKQDYWPHEIHYLRDQLSHDLSAAQRGLPCPAVSVSTDNG
ncbi:MAG TPA: hypothetical protein VFQ88_11610 [Nevskiaceae bacterium]|nr:hypothetical protein [Nevskiaceae bacterium]